MRRWPLGLGVGLGLLAAWLGWRLGHNVGESWLLASRYTARVGFPMLMAVFCGAALARLWRSELTGSLSRDRQWWWLGFVATQTVHLYALIRYAPYAKIPTPRDGYFIYALIYAVALTANDRSRRVMGRWWEWLQEVGVDVAWLVYTVVYVAEATIPDKRASALPLAAIAIGGLGIRLFAWTRRKV